jgi:hypothetical protein
MGVVTDPPIIEHLRERISAYDGVPLAERESGIVTVVCGDDLNSALGIRFRAVASCFDGVGIFIVTAEAARRVLDAWDEVASACEVDEAA